MAQSQSRLAHAMLMPIAPSPIRQNDCAPKTLASSGTSGRVEPSTTVDDARTAAPCRVHSSSSALLPLAVHLSMLQSTSHNNITLSTSSSSLCGRARAQGLRAAHQPPKLVSSDTSDLRSPHAGETSVWSQRTTLFASKSPVLKRSDAHLRLHPSQLDLQKQLHGVHVRMWCDSTRAQVVRTRGGQMQRERGARAEWIAC